MDILIISDTLGGIKMKKFKIFLEIIILTINAIYLFEAKIAPSLKNTIRRILRKKMILLNNNVLNSTLLNNI